MSYLSDKKNHLRNFYLASASQKSISFFSQDKRTGNELIIICIIVIYIVTHKQLSSEARKISFEQNW